MVIKIPPEWRDEWMNSVRTSTEREKEPIRVEEYNN